MQKLKRRLTSARTTMPDQQSEATETTPGASSGTYPISNQLAEEVGEVTLVVYGWHNVQPGTLSWVFPSFEAAMRAARALRNATQWAIMGGSDASGRILAERGV